MERGFNIKNFEEPARKDLKERWEEMKAIIYVNREQ
jgi:hypothetical protein